MKKPDRSSYTPLDFLEWSEAGTLEISPKFQRRGVWNRAAKSYLIDTMILEMPIPPIYIRVTQNDERTKMIREIVDGQQRISAVLDYINGKYSLAKNIESDCVGSYFSDLDKKIKDKITQFSFICESFTGVDDSDVLRIFARLNTHSVRLNAQELRNGKYFGQFKRSAYNLALEHLEFWREHKIFTETRIARMMEVELTSELMILEMSGLQDKKKAIDRFYEDYDEEFLERKNVENRFRRTIDIINDACYSNISSTEFRRPPLFYSLFAAVYHRLYGLRNSELNTPRNGRLPKNELQKLSDAIVTLSEYIISEKENEEAPRAYKNFVNACLRQTDNIRPRRTRMETIYNTAFE